MPAKTSRRQVSFCADDDKNILDGGQIHRWLDNGLSVERASNAVVKGIGPLRDICQDLFVAANSDVDFFICVEHSRRGDDELVCNHYAGTFRDIMQESEAPGAADRKSGIGRTRLVLANVSCAARLIRDRAEKRGITE